MVSPLLGQVQLCRGLERGHGAPGANSGAIPSRGSNGSCWAARLYLLPAGRRGLARRAAAESRLRVRSVAGATRTWWLHCDALPCPLCRGSEHLPDAIFRRVSVAGTCTRGTCQREPGPVCDRADSAKAPPAHGRAARALQSLAEASFQRPWRWPARLAKQALRRRARFRRHVTIRRSPPGGRLCASLAAGRSRLCSWLSLWTGMRWGSSRRRGRWR